MTDTIRLDLVSDPVDLTAALVDIPSVSHDEERIADAVEAALRTVPGVEVHRIRNNVVARTNRGLGRRVILAGHLDTVPPSGNEGARRAPGADGTPAIHGLGSVDMKQGDAVYLNAFATLADDPALTRDMTLVMYECEEVAARFSGLAHLIEEHRELLDGDAGLLGEPSGGMIEAGCQGTLRIRVGARGVRAHSARAWLGDNAIHKLSPVLARVAAYEAATVDVDGLEYREGLQVTRIEGGEAANTVPDEAWAFVNFRFAPSRTTGEAKAHMEHVLGLDIGEEALAEAGLWFEYDDVSDAGNPGLADPAVAELVEATGGRVRPKYGWTDVARLSAMGIPAVNFGPGDPSLCHKPEEHCPEASIRDVSETLKRYLTS